MTFFSLLQKFLQLDSYEISEGKALKVNVSEPKTRLFLGNIPKLKGKDEIEEEFTKLTGKRKLKLLICSNGKYFPMCHSKLKGHSPILLCNMWWFLPWIFSWMIMSCGKGKELVLPYLSIIIAFLLATSQRIGIAKNY